MTDQSDRDAQGTEAPDSRSNEIPLTIDRSATSPVPGITESGEATLASRAEINDPTPPRAKTVSLETRPNFHIPGEKEALQAIETPGNGAAVGKPDEADSAESDHLTEQTIEVASGDTLSTIFERVGLGYSDVMQVLEIGDEARQLERIRPGDKLTLILKEERFAGLKYDLDADSELNIFREQDDHLVAEINDLPSESSAIAAGGTVKGSLYQSAIAAGVPPAQVLQLAEIFGWKMDFVRDVRNGDQFKLIYEVRERDGEQLGTGKILAAEYHSGDRKIQAVRYTSPDGTTGYYEPDGSSLERGFLRYPVEYSRISSNFNPRRLHPIHNTVRPHNGVDLAAPTGTSVKSAAPGRVTFVGWKHGYGKVIQVRHDEKYDTLYAHLSGFKGSLKRGAVVEKGDTIGYVGMTGAATGPHLHYELRVNGKPYDPVKVELPEANPIPSEHREDFLAETRVSMDQLARVRIDSSAQPIHLAQNEPTSND
ncbi:peptidoglycan DD-metalloendopeptidase family protein [Guyparkeria sp.]|uniref:peptidoglycan DD-metalloendopeptidase family protein n=1 Tax=Guyparkeria sp. TaxID=2035736 RepID=UPI0039710C6C